MYHVNISESSAHLSLDISHHWPSVCASGNTVSQQTGCSRISAGLMHHQGHIHTEGKVKSCCFSCLFRLSPACQMKGVKPEFHFLPQESRNTKTKLIMITTKEINNYVHIKDFLKFPSLGLMKYIYLYRGMLASLWSSVCVHLMNCQTFSPLLVLVWYFPISILI